MYELFEHTADLGLRIKADNLDALFADAGRALFSAVVANLQDVRPVESVTLSLDGDELDYLLFDWLNELLYAFESRHLLFSQFDVHLRAGGLDAEIKGEPMDPNRHLLEHEVKAITYHALKLKRSGNGWLAEVIVDI